MCFNGRIACLQLKIAACQVFGSHCSCRVKPPVLLWPVSSSALLGLLAKLSGEQYLLLYCNSLRPGSLGKSQKDLLLSPSLEAYQLSALLLGQHSHLLLPLRVLEPTVWWVGDLGCVTSWLWHALGSLMLDLALNGYVVALQ